MFWLVFWNYQSIWHLHCLSCTSVPSPLHCGRVPQGCLPHHWFSPEPFVLSFTGSYGDVDDEMNFLPFILHLFLSCLTSNFLFLSLHPLLLCLTCSPVFFKISSSSLWISASFSKTMTSWILLKCRSVLEFSAES